MFVLPRVILHWKHEHNEESDTKALQALSVKLFRFGILMFVLALTFGIWLWLMLGIQAGWLYLKISLVLVLFLYFLACGWLVYLAKKKNKFLSEPALRIFNEASLLFVIPILYLAVSKQL